MLYDRGSSLSQDSHPLEAVLFQCLDAKARLGETDQRPVPLPQCGTTLKGQPCSRAPYGICYTVTAASPPSAQSLIPHGASPPINTFRSSRQSLFLENLTQDHKRRLHSAAQLPKATHAPQGSGSSQIIVSTSPTDHWGWDALLMGPLFLASSFLGCHILTQTPFWTHTCLHLLTSVLNLS